MVVVILYFHFWPDTCQLSWMGPYWQAVGIWCPRWTPLSMAVCKQEMGLYVQTQTHLSCYIYGLVPTVWSLGWPMDANCNVSRLNQAVSWIKNICIQHLSKYSIIVQIKKSFSRSFVCTLFKYFLFVRKKPLSISFWYVHKIANLTFLQKVKKSGAYFQNCMKWRRIHQLLNVSSVISFCSCFVF